MFLNQYIKKFGQKSFDEYPFNDVDALALSSLAIISLDDFSEEDGSFRLGDVKKEYITKDIFYDSPDRKLNEIQLIEMTQSKRYQDLIIKNIERRYSIEKVNQFYAITVILPDQTKFISFRGTDITLIAWKEDFDLATKDAFLGQIQALEYVRNVIKDDDNKFYIGGHSKGGNLACYATLNLTKEECKRLIKTYSFDGPGFKNPVTDFPGYSYGHKKISKYLTYNNVVGSIFNQAKKYKVVYSNGLLLGGHNLYYWQINANTGDFNFAKDVSPISKKYTSRLMDFVNSLTIEDRIFLFDAFFEVFKDCETIFDLPTKGALDIINIRKNLGRRYDKAEIDKLSNMLKTLLYYMFLIDTRPKSK